MAQKMLQYIKEQPVLWQSMMENRKALFQETAEGLKERPERIVILGSGSSLIAAMAAAEFYQEMLSIETTAVVPTKLESLMRLLDPSETLMIAVSQSGKSTSTIQAVETCRARGFTTLGVTADETSPTAEKCSFHQQVACGEEVVGPKTKGMTGTVLTLFLLGMELGNVWGIACSAFGSRFLADMDLAIQAAPANLERCMEFCSKKQELLACLAHCIVISEDAGYYAAQEGALKLLETLYIPVMAYEFEEYMHGINNTIEPGICHIFLPAGAENAGRMATLERYTREKGCINLVVTSLDWEEGPDTLKLVGSANPFCSLFQALLAFQVMSVYGSQRKNIECDRPKFSDFYGVMNTKA